jgi:hypothetical protein
MKFNTRWILAISALLAGLQLAACAPAPTTTAKTAPSKLEPIEGSDFKRVVLTEKAADRLDIQTVAVRSEPATRVRRVGGRVVAMPAKRADTASSADNAALDAQAADLGRLRVQVNLSQSELNQVDRSQPARVLPLADDEQDSDEEESGLEAELDDDIAGIDDAEETKGRTGSASLYYAVNNPHQVLEPGQPVLVKLTLTGSGNERKIVPFAALLYGVHGETWVYTNPEPLAFVRAVVIVDYIEDEHVFLLEGPPVGMQVVTVGGSLLYGAETGVSK